MIRVLHLGKFYPPYFGGIEKVSYDLVEGLNKEFISADVLCFNHKKGNSFTNDSYKIYRTNTLLNIASAPLSLNYISTFNRIVNSYDLIHVHLPNPIANLAVFLARPKCKVIVHWHSDIVKQKVLLKFYRPLQNWLLERADKIITTSPVYYKRSRDLIRYKKKIESIPLGIDSKEFPIDNCLIKKIKDKYSGKKIIFSLGRLIYYKGFEYLIEAAGHLDEDYVVLIGGDGELKGELNKLISENKIQGKVKLLGRIPFNNLGAYYKSCDLFCMPSVEKSEAFGVVQIEAMSFAKPVVSSDIKGSGVPWVNKEGFSGKIVEPKNSKQLALAISYIVENKEIYSEYSKNALFRYKDLFTKEKMVEKFKKLYKNILDE